MNKIHNTFMLKAIQLSSQYKDDKISGGPFACVIVKDGKIIAQGKNQVLTKNDPTLHGEIDAIRKACKKLKTFDLAGCDLYVNCEPCPMCLMACKWARISHVYFATTRKTAAKIGFQDDFLHTLLKKTTKTGTHLKELDQKAAEIMFDWKKKYKDKYMY